MTMNEGVCKCKMSLLLSDKNKYLGFPFVNFRFFSVEIRIATQPNSQYYDSENSGFWKMQQYCFWAFYKLGFGYVIKGFGYVIKQYV